jgi:hypothetical protein
MAKTNYKILLSAVAIFVMALTLYISHSFAWTVSNDYYSHEHTTDITNPSLVCGDHKCTLGGAIHSPAPLEPYKGSHR